MKWRFTLIDKEGTSTEIDEPVGWDAVSIEVTRDKEAHGIFFDYQGNDFTFYDTAYQLLKQAYDADGVEAYYVMLIEQDCGGTWTELYRGRLLFVKAEFSCGIECSVKMNMETVSDVMTLRNRWDQKADLISTQAFDGASLPSYNHLGKDISLPPKTIVLQNDAVWSFEENVTNRLQEIGPYKPDMSSIQRTFTWFSIGMQYDDVKISEFGAFAPLAAPQILFICKGYPSSPSVMETNCVDAYKSYSKPGAPYSWLLFDQGFPSIINRNNGNSSDSARFVDKFDISGSYSIEIKTNYSDIRYLQKFIAVRHRDGTYTKLKDEMVVVADSIFSPDTSKYWYVNETHTVTDSFSFQNVPLADGDYVFLSLNGVMSYPQMYIDADLPGIEFTSKSGFIKIVADSQLPATLSKTFMVHEALSRIAEIYTNGKIRAYSEYFGRTDSQPFVYGQDGCGSLEAITNGIFIRRKENRIPDEPAPMPVSMDDMMKGLGPIHNIGFGIEMSGGHYTLRVEPWRYFYKDIILLNAEKVADVKRFIDPSLYFSTFQIGYEKWEAEGSNGLDEFLTKRTYRSELTTVRNELSKLSKFIASGYAIEMTRRNKLNDNDWRYDNDTFIICMKRGGSQDFFIYFESQYYFLVAAFGDNYDLAESYFVPGRSITINTGLNVGAYTVISVERVPGNLKVTVAQPTVGELAWVNVSGGTAMTVEQGNIVNAENIIDPDSIYNYRISPVRNAMRWAPKFLEGYRWDGALIFTAGDGNFFAKGKQSGDCRIEKKAISENETIDKSIFEKEADAVPAFLAERISFEYPLNVADFNAILQQPYGRIVIQNDCINTSGWIDSVKYEPNAGRATFVIIPQREL